MNVLDPINRCSSLIAVDGGVCLCAACGFWRAGTAHALHAAGRAGGHVVESTCAAFKRLGPGHGGGTVA